MTDSKDISLDPMIAVLNQLVQAGNAQASALSRTLPGFTTTATTATAGTNGAPPAQTALYLNISIGGTSYKIALYLP